MKSEIQLYSVKYIKDNQFCLKLDVVVKRILSENLPEFGNLHMYTAKEN